MPERDRSDRPGTAGRRVRHADHLDDGRWPEDGPHGDPTKSRGSEPIGPLADAQDAARLDGVEAEGFGPGDDLARRGPRVEPDLARVLARDLVEDAEDRLGRQVDR